MNIIEKYKDVSFKNGKFLSDKSYAYDTVYFTCKFIRDYSENGNFDLYKHKITFNKYIADIFNKNEDNSDIGNYYSEVLCLLEYSKVVYKRQRGIYEIIDLETLNYICHKMENAYIFLYVLSYHTIRNSNLLNKYIEYCETDNEMEKINILKELNIKLTELNPSVGCSPDDQWAKQNTEYILNVLNFYNDQYRVTRTLLFDINLGIRNTESISVNVNGTRTIQEKNNAYLQNFDYNYVDSVLKNIKVKKEI